MTRKFVHPHLTLAQLENIGVLFQVQIYVKEVPRGVHIGPGSRCFYWVYRDSTYTWLYNGVGKPFVLPNACFAVESVPNTTRVQHTEAGADFWIGQNRRSLPSELTEKVAAKPFIKRLLATLE